MDIFWNHTFATAVFNTHCFLLKNKELAFSVLAFAMLSEACVKEDTETGQKRRIFIT